MAICLPSAAKHILCRSSLTANKRCSTSLDVPKGFFPVYVGKIPKEEIFGSSILLEPTFISRFAKQSRRRVRFRSSNGRSVTIPCHEDVFMDVTSRLN